MADVLAYHARNTRDLKSSARSLASGLRRLAAEAETMAAAYEAIAEDVEVKTTAHGQDLHTIRQVEQARERYLQVLTAYGQTLSMVR